MMMDGEYWAGEYMNEIGSDYDDGSNDNKPLDLLPVPDLSEGLNITSTERPNEFIQHHHIETQNNENNSQNRPQINMDKPPIVVVAATKMSSKESSLYLDINRCIIEGNLLMRNFFQDMTKSMFGTQMTTEETKYVHTTSDLVMLDKLANECGTKIEPKIMSGNNTQPDNTKRVSGVLYVSTEQKSDPRKIDQLTMICSNLKIRNAEFEAMYAAFMELIDNHPVLSKRKREEAVVLESSEQPPKKKSRKKK